MFDARIKFHDAVDLMGGEEELMYAETIDKAFARARECQAPRKQKAGDIVVHDTSDESTDEEERKKRSGPAVQEEKSLDKSEDDGILGDAAEMLGDAAEALEDAAEFAAQQVYRFLDYLTSDLKGLDIEEWAWLGLDKALVDTDVGGFFTLDTKADELKAAAQGKFKGCWNMGTPNSFEFNGKNLTRSQYYAVLLRLENEMTLSYDRFAKFMIQFQIEVWFGAKAAREREERELFTMLNEAGYRGVTPEWLHNLDSQSKTWRKITRMLDSYQQQQKVKEKEFDDKREVARKKMKAREKAALGIIPPDAPPADIEDGGFGFEGQEPTDLSNMMAPDFGDPDFKMDELDLDEFQVEEEFQVQTV